jgi:hypothetical protein
VARHRAHGVQHSLVPDIPARSRQLLIDHFFTIRKKVRYGLCAADAEAQLKQQKSYQRSTHKLI